MKVLTVTDSKIASRLAESAALRHLVHRDPRSGAWLLSAKTAEALPKIKGIRVPSGAIAPAPVDLDPNRLAETMVRLLIGWAASVNEPLPEALLDEVRLLLYASPALCVEYMGRGRVTSELHLPAPTEDLITMDIAGGRRNYMFRQVRAAPGQEDERTRAIGARYAAYRQWLLDPGARVVVSLGGGGFRMFAANAVLKAIDRLAGDRGRIGEVWGSSGGAFLGYAYASGYNPAVLDELGFELYHGRSPHLMDGSTASILRNAVRSLADTARGRKSNPEMEAWIDWLEQRHPPEQRPHPKLPFYPIATNPNRTGIVALADPRDIPSYCRDIIFPCDIRAAVAASTAVPFLLRAQRDITGLTEDTWIDGSITDENPLTLPFVKWLRDREQHPDTTPERLKIVLVNLNLRTTEWPMLKFVSELPGLKQTKLVRRTAKLVDLVMDSKTHSSIQMLTEMRGVEVMALKLNLGKLNFKDPREIPFTIRSGRTIEAWQVTTYRKGL